MLKAALSPPRRAATLMATNANADILHAPVRVSAGHSEEARVDVLRNPARREHPIFLRPHGRHWRQRLRWSPAHRRHPQRRHRSADCLSWRAQTRVIVVFAAIAAMGERS
jgi:arylamine N-acetyltransferase